MPTAIDSSSGSGSRRREAAVGPLIRVEAPASLGEVVFARVRDAIVSRALPPGERVAEAVLAEQLGVSRTPVRETLWRLRQMGLVEAVGRKGYRVAFPSRPAIEHAYELREALEVFAAGVAAERGTEAELEQVAAAAQASHRQARDGDLTAFRRQDERFHRLICDPARNPRLQMYIEDTWALAATLRARDVLYEQASIACGEAHVAIGEALLRRDRPAVERRMARHVRQVRDYVLQASELGSEPRTNRKDDR